MKEDLEKGYFRNEQGEIEYDLVLEADQDYAEMTYQEDCDRFENIYDIIYELEGLDYPYVSNQKFGPDTLDTNAIVRYIKQRVEEKYKNR